MDNLNPESSVIDRMRYGPTYVLRKPRPRLLGCSLILVIFGIIGMLRSDLWIGALSPIGLIMLVWLSFLGPFDNEDWMAPLSDDQLVLSSQARTKSNYWAMLFLYIVILYLALTAESPTWPRPVTSFQWIQICNLAIFGHFGLHQFFLHRLAARQLAAVT